MKGDAKWPVAVTSIEIAAGVLRFFQSEYSILFITHLSTANNTPITKATTAMDYPGGDYHGILQDGMAETDVIHIPPTQPTIQDLRVRAAISLGVPLPSATVNSLVPFPEYSESEAESSKSSEESYEFVMGVGEPMRVPGQGEKPFTRGVIEPLIHSQPAGRVEYGGGIVMVSSESVL